MSAALGMYSATGNAPEAHTGQHLQGCVSCYAFTEARAAGRRIPAVGDRDINDAVLLGETYAIEVIVAQADIHPGTLQPRIIGRPEGTVSMAFARTTWREVGS